MTFASDGTAIICGIVRQNEGVTMPLRNARTHGRTFFTIDFRESSLSLSCRRIGIECHVTRCYLERSTSARWFYSICTSYVRFKYESRSGSTAGMIFISLYCYLLRRSRVNDDIRLHVEEIKLFAGDREHCRLIFRTECANVRKKFGIIFSLWLTLLMISHVYEELKIILCSLFFDLRRKFLRFGFIFSRVLFFADNWRLHYDKQKNHTINNSKIIIRLYRCYYTIMVECVIVNGCLFSKWL